MKGCEENKHVINVVLEDVEFVEVDVAKVPLVNVPA